MNASTRSVLRALPVIGALLAVSFCVDAGVSRALAQTGQPSPAIQLGDSVTAPVRAINAGHESTLAFYIPEKDLLAESIAYDPKDGSFYVGSTRKGKIVRVDRSGAVSDFITPRQDGLWSVIGIKIHATRRVLWVCSWNGGNLEGFKPDEGHASGVFTFNLDTGKLITKWVLDTPGEVHGFNDLVLTRAGSAYVTHMFAEASIYRIEDKVQKLKSFAHSAALREPNGITITPDERTLFVACADGIIVVDCGTGASRALAVPPGVSTGELDGLYYYRGSLVGIQGNSVVRYRLDDALSHVVLMEVLEKDHPLFDTPTTGVIVDNAFYYIANAQFDALQKDGSLPMDKLNETAILKLVLR